MELIVEPEKSLSIKRICCPVRGNVFKRTLHHEIVLIAMNPVLTQQKQQPDKVAGYHDQITNRLNHFPIPDKVRQEEQKRKQRDVEGKEQQTHPGLGMRVFRVVLLA